MHVESSRDFGADVIRYVLLVLWLGRVSGNGLYGALCVFLSADIITAYTTAFISTNFCLTKKVSNGMNSGGEVCYPRLPWCVCRLYTSGVNMDTLALYPPVQLPVSSSTTWLSPLVRWDHSDSWDIPDFEDLSAVLAASSSATVEFNVSSPDSKDAYLCGHMVDGRRLFPAPGYLVMAWQKFAKMHGKNYEETPVCFDDIHIYRATILPASGKHVNL